MSTHSRRLRIAAALLAAVGSLGAARRAAAQQPAQSVSILAPLTPAETRARVLKTLLESGYTVADTSASVIHTERREVQHVLHLELFAKLLTADDLTTRVVLTGDYTVDMMHEDPIRVQEASTGTAGEMWDQLREVGERLRRALAAPKP